MANKDGVWSDEEVKSFIWEHICNAEAGKVNFKPLLLDTHRETPRSSELAKAVSQMQNQGYVIVNKPNYDHYWIKLNGSGKSRCKKLIK